MRHLKGVARRSRKHGAVQMWRVYQRGLERWLADLLQPVFDNLVAEVAVPRFVQRLRILEFTLDHEAPTFSRMRRRSSRKDSDLNGVVDVRYTGGARMLLLIEVGQGRWRFKVPPQSCPFTEPKAGILQCHRCKHCS